MPVLDRYLGVGRQLSVEKIFQKCRVAIAVLVRDWLEFEQDAKLKRDLDRYDAENFQLDLVNERIKRLLAFRTLTFFAEELPYIPKPDEQPAHRYQSDWLYYATAGDGAVALLQLTGLPQSSWHDEYMFLRTIHITECCFWGAIVGIKHAAQAYAHQNTDRAVYGLREAGAFCSILVKLFSIFETMPVSSFFDGFRKATGDASAIQSRKYQELELLIRGFSKNKASAIAKKDEVSDFPKLTINRKYTLPGMLRSARNRKDGDEIINAIDRTNGWRFRVAAASWDARPSADRASSPQRSAAQPRKRWALAAPLRVRLTRSPPLPGHPRGRSGHLLSPRAPSPHRRCTHVRAFELPPIPRP